MIFLKRLLYKIYKKGFVDGFNYTSTTINTTIQKQKYKTY